MMTTSQSGRRGLVWAILGGAVLVAGIVAVIIGSTLGRPIDPSPTPSASQASEMPSTSASDSPTTPVSDIVDAAASQRGWVPEPITTDADAYMRAAIAAASTFDTTLSTRDEWLAYLDTWFTSDTRYPEADRAERLKASQVELRQGVVLPDAEWQSLAGEDGRVVATTTGDVNLTPVAEDASGDMSIGTVDVTLTFTRSDGGDGETSYDEQVRVSVQVLCGPGSVPTPGSAQRAGDCKVVRYFTEPLEP